VVRQLLERGANIGMKNRWGEVPINKILPDTMEDFLNQHCLQSTKVSFIKLFYKETN
jgi:delta 1-pyrroline-5-carboxylate dehydrogenase